MRALFIFLVLVYLATNFGCTKDAEIPKAIQNEFVSQELKDWAYFKPGSYWIVRDSVTAAEDSIYVSSVSSKMVQRSFGDTLKFSEEITVEFNKPGFYPDYILSSYQKNTVRLSFTSGTELVVFNLDTLDLKTNVGDGILKNYSVSDYNMHGISFGSTRYVYFFYYYYPPSFGQAVLNDYVYWKKNVGIIKQRKFPSITNYSTREVIRYKVVQ